MKPLVNNNSAIRAMFEEGKKLAAIYGAENVYDFSLGNPNVPAPEAVNQAICDILKEAGSYGIQEWIGYAAIERIDGSFPTTKTARSIPGRSPTAPAATTSTWAKVPSSISTAFSSTWHRYASAAGRS